MPPRPIKVRKPILRGFPEDDVDYFSPIMKFAEVRVARLARRTIHRMQRLPASGQFEGEARGLKTVWDEWCWYQHKYDSDCGLLSWAFEETLNGMIAGLLREIEEEEAVLITIAVCDVQDNMPARDDAELIDAIRECVTEAAAERSLARFEVW